MPINQAGDMNDRRDVAPISDEDQQVGPSHLSDGLVFVLTYQKMSDDAGDSGSSLDFAIKAVSILALSLKSSF